MLASAGRRYLLTLLNNAHSISCTQQPTGVQQLAALQPLLQQTCSRTFITNTPHASDEGSSEAQQQQPSQQQQQQAAPEQQQQHQQQAAPLAAPSQQQDTDDVTPQQAAPKQPIQQAFAAMGPRKVDPSLFGSSKGPRAKREGIVHVNSTHNNTHLVLTDRASKVETWVSGGTVGYKNANKATPMAAELAAKELARRAIDKGFHSVVVKLKGMGKNKQFAVQSLAASGLTVTQIWDVTPIPYNGCRLPRRRRV